MEKEFDYQLKEELKRCDGCREWLDNGYYRLNRNGKILFFHPFCFFLLTHKNPNYKSLHDGFIKNIYSSHSHVK